jgi:hypothetical protein
MAQCSVCCSTYSSAIRKLVVCPSCQYEACAACVKKYILNSTKDADCMACHKVFDREYLTGALTKSFIDSTYRAHRENILVERELALLPDTQHALANYRIAESLKTDVVASGRLIDQMKRTIIDIHATREMQSRQLHRIVAGGFTTDGTYGNGESSRQGGRERRERFICGCPVEECRGFVSSSTHLCGTCSLKICKDCLEPFEEMHACDPNKVATATLLKRDSKPCPKCAVMITKISGCDQMWCTACHVAFSWRTGEVETNHIHNPHYYQWQRMRSANGEIPREPGDRPDLMCNDDELPTLNTLATILSTVHNLPSSHPWHMQITRVHREVRHIQRVELYGLRVDTADQRERHNLDLRLQYLLNRIDRTEWKRKLILREKATSRKLELRQIYEMYCTVAIDNINGLRRDNGKTPLEAVTEIKALARHANDAFKSACGRYTCNVRTVYGANMSLPDDPVPIEEDSVF